MDFEKIISCQTDAIIIDENRLMDFFDFEFLSFSPRIQSTNAKLKYPARNFEKHKLVFNIGEEIDIDISLTKLTQLGKYYPYSTCNCFSQQENACQKMTMWRNIKVACDMMWHTKKEGMSNNLNTLKWAYLS